MIMTGSDQAFSHSGIFSETFYVFIPHKSPFTLVGYKYNYISPTQPIAF